MCFNITEMTWSELPLQQLQWSKRCNGTLICFSGWIHKFVLHWCSWDSSVCLWIHWIWLLIQIICQEITLDGSCTFDQHEDRSWIPPRIINERHQFKIFCRCCGKNVFKDPADYDDDDGLISSFGTLEDVMPLLLMACYYHRLKSAVIFGT